MGSLNSDNFIQIVKKAVGRRKIEALSKDDICDAIKTDIETVHNISVDKVIIDNIVNQLCNKIVTWKIDRTKDLKWIPDFETVEQRDEYFEKLAPSVAVPEEYVKIWNQYQHLLNLPQPVQRSKEWFELRNRMITASSAAQAMGESKYDKPDKLVLEKIGLGEKFKENKFVYHGKKYEKIATMIYENIYNVKIGEFGLIPHPTIPFLGASPDGIAMNLTLDGKFCPRVGRMLEIKCPLSREILTCGKEDGEICPHYYWVQVQIQLECCDLDECDFWQCNIRECTLDEWKEDIETKHTEGQNEKITIDKRLTKGVILQFLPKKQQLDRYERLEWYSKYIYPPKMVFESDDAYLAWANDMSKQYFEHYPELAKDYYFDKMLYWRLELSHNYLIKRDKQWFETAHPKLKSFWDRVLLYRENDEERDKFVASKKKPERVDDMFSD